jgi:hypothetical protein
MELRVKSIFSHLIKKALLAVLIILITLIFAEVLLSLGLNSNIISKPERNWDFYKNTYVGDTPSCNFQDSLEAHPFFGWMIGESESCRNFVRNNKGFWDRRDLPDLKDPNFYSILVLGGSVASQFSRGSADDDHPRHWLEDELNSNFKSPNGMPFRVLSGSMGVWKMPTQINVTAMFGSSVDAVISLDGYNEMLGAYSKLPIDRPDSWTWFSVLNHSKSSNIIAALQILKKFRLLVISTPLLKELKLPFLIYDSSFRLITGGDRLSKLSDKSLPHHFSYPKNWTLEQAESANIEKWKNYLRGLRGISEGLGLKYLHFVQPIPNIGKVLTDEEKNNYHQVSAEDYLKIIVRPAESLKEKGYPLEIMTNVFENTKETVYRDAIHCGYDKDLDSLGYRIMAKSMAQSIGKFWKLKKLNSN